MKIRILLTSFICVLLACSTGCTSQYSWVSPFFTSSLENLSKCEFSHDLAEIQTFSSEKELRGACEKALRTGFIVQGSMSFTSPLNPTIVPSVQQFAKTVGASKVFILEKFSSRENGAIPITMPNYYQTNYSGTVGGTYYNGTASTFGGTSTTYIPYSINRYSYDILFFAPAKNKDRLGIYFEDLPEQERGALEYDYAIKVTAVVKNSLAYKNQIREGDIIYAWNGMSILSHDDFLQQLNESHGETTIGIIRNGKQMVKKVIFPGVNAL